MTNEQLLYAIGGIDHDLIEEAEKKPKYFPHLLKNFAKAACFVILFSAIVYLTVPLLKNGSPIKAPINEGGSGFSGDYSVSWYNPDNPGNSGDRVFFPNWSYDGAILEMRLIEILGEEYMVPRSAYKVSVAKFEIVDEVIAGNFPREIYVSFIDSDISLLEEFDSLIASVEQIGIKGYPLINLAKNEVEQFENMFEPAGFISNLRSGTFIPFKDGVVDQEFFEDGRYLEHLLDYIDYPAAKGDTPELVKDKIKSRIPTDSFESKSIYQTPDDVFFGEEALGVKEYIYSENSIFRNSISFKSDGLYCCTFERLIGGFPAGELIQVFADGSVKKLGFVYNNDETQDIPALGKVIETIDTSDFTPPNLNIGEEDTLLSFNVDGYYQKIFGKPCGIIVVTWNYRNEHGYSAVDHLYLLYGQDGNGSVISREILSGLLGSNNGIMSDPSTYYYRIFVFNNTELLNQLYQR